MPPRMLNQTRLLKDLKLSSKGLGVFLWKKYLKKNLSEKVSYIWAYTKN